jgi:hypothetical protein
VCINAPPLVKPIDRLLSNKGSEFASYDAGGIVMLLLLILLFVLLFASVPAWPYSRGWGYYPSGGLGFVLVILVVLMLAGRI